MDPYFFFLTGILINSLEDWWGKTLKNWNSVYSVHLEEWRTHTWQSWKVRMCIICNHHCTFIKHWWRKNGCYGNPPDNWWWCLCIHMYSLFLCFQRSYTTRICLWQSFFKKENSECCGAIIDNISYAPICVLEEKYRKSKGALKNMLRKLFYANCIVEFALKVTANDSS